jgi:DNA polymerase III delta subunit
MILYLHGENSFAISQQVRAITKKYTESTGSDGDMQNIDVHENGIQSLLSSLPIMPMFVTSRLIIASNLAKAKPTAEQIDEIINNTAESTNLIITDPNPDKRTSMYKKLSKLKGAKEFKNLVGSELTKWVSSEAKNSQAEISPTDSYNKKITKTTIDELAVPSLENNTFVLTEALASKDLARVLNLYKEIKLQGHADQLILGAITYQYRTILLVLLNNSELNRAYKMSPYALGKARSVAKNYTLEDIKKAYQIISEADINTKTGELSSGEAMNRLFYRLCSI